MALHIEDEPPQSFSAGFDLRGTATEGELRLYTPLGSTLAKFEWSPGLARLEQGQETRTSSSLDSLLHELMGQALPVIAMFDWLQGKATDTTGWQADLGAFTDGRIVAIRTQPLPRTTLRIALSR